MNGSDHCLENAREVQEKPGMKTTAGLLGSPVASAQIWVPSAEVTFTAKAEAARERVARIEANFMMLGQ